MDLVSGKWLGSEGKLLLEVKLLTVNIFAVLLFFQQV
jgi:hypothetical protein